MLAEDGILASRQFGDSKLAKILYCELKPAGERGKGEVRRDDSVSAGV